MAVSFTSLVYFMKENTLSREYSKQLVQVIGEVRSC